MPLKPGALVTSARAALLEAIELSHDRIELASPFLSAPIARTLAQSLLASDAPHRRLLTALDPRAAATGVLSLDGLRDLQQVGVEIRTLANLHAKLALVDGFALAGSGNLTGSGLGGGPRDNVELGVVLNATQRTAAAKLFRRWWRAADPLTDAMLDHCARRAKRIIVPARAARPYGPAYRDQPGERVESQRRRDSLRSTGLWLKMMHIGVDHKFDSETWISSAHFLRGGVAKNKPSFVPGDLLVFYAVNDGRCTAILQVTGEMRFDPATVRAAGGRTGPDDADRWGWVTDVRLLHQTEKQPPTLQPARRP